MSLTLRNGILYPFQDPVVLEDILRLQEIKETKKIRKREGQGYNENDRTTKTTTTTMNDVEFYMK